MKDSIRVGPRKTAFREFWLSLTGTPWFVVSARPLESTRTRVSEAAAGLKLSGGVPEPTFGDGLVSVSVLPATRGSGGSTLWPTAGESPESSEGFAALNGNAAASASVPA